MMSTLLLGARQVSPVVTFLTLHASQLVMGAWIVACVAICVVMTRSKSRFIRFAGWFFAGMVAGVVMLSLAAVVYHALSAGGAA